MCSDKRSSMWKVEKLHSNFMQYKKVNANRLKNKLKTKGKIKLKENIVEYFHDFRGRFLTQDKKK